MTDIEPLVKRIKQHTPVSDACAFGFLFPDGKVTFTAHGACHADLGYKDNKKAVAVGNGTNKGRGGNYNDPTNPVSQDFLRWSISDDSVYAPIIGGRVTPVTSGTTLKGYVVQDIEALNIKLLMNFMKSVRNVSEHSDVMSFWKKWKIDKGKNPGLVFLLSAFFNHNGDPQGMSHGVLESYALKGCIDIRKFVSNTHGLWDEVLYKYPFSDPKVSYGGENKETWGGGTFDPYKIRKAGKHEPPTLFYKKFFEKPVGQGATDEDLEQFFDDAEKGVYNG